MVAKLLTTQGLDDLGSQDQLQLLDAIDSLRSQGISQHVSLPQIIVCGDQSSGKSSVLEAISGVSFPVKANTSTRFPTELILRRTASPSVKVSIAPHHSHSDTKKKSLSEYREELKDFADLPNLIENAKTAMGIIALSKAFSQDILRIEISGPDRPHLTIVDLPGLIHSETKHQSEADIKLITDVVEKYMKEPRSIILAVVSAKNDFANQIVLRLARNADPRGHRTLGIITKPDCLAPQSGSERMYLSLAKNYDVELRHGWHVLRNRDTDSDDWGLAERDAHEQEFFSTSISWSALPPAHRGIKTLREKLSKLLLHQIASELPNLRIEITTKLKECQSELAHLGTPRSTIQEQRLYLIEVSVAAQTLLKAAVDGTHEGPFFRGTTSYRDDSGYERRIRSVMRNINDGFADKLTKRGHFYSIVSEKTPKAAARSRNIVIARDHYVESIVDMLGRSRGRELPGMFNPLIVTELFRKQATPWQSITEEHIKAAWNASCLFMRHLITHVADSSTARTILEDIVSPKLDIILENLLQEAKRLLKPHQVGHPITNNHDFTETLQKMRSERQKSQFAKIIQDFHTAPERRNHYLQSADFDPLLDELVNHTERNLTRFAASEALDYSEAYYKVALKRFIDDVAVEVVERCLMGELGNIFNPLTVAVMPEDEIALVAGESEESSEARRFLEDSIKTLKSGVQICKAFIGFQVRESDPHEEGPGEEESVEPSNSSRYEPPDDIKEATEIPIGESNWAGSEPGDSWGASIDEPEQELIIDDWAPLSSMKEKKKKKKRLGFSAELESERLHL